MNPTDATTWDWLRMMLSFPIHAAPLRRSQRTKMYQEAAKRREARAGAIDYPSMMRSLELTSEWREATKEDLSRIHELLSRTNQFNTTTMRLTLPEVAELIESKDATVHLATLGDKFGKLGIVGVVITRRTDGVLTYDSIVMSCRAMGFGLESLLLAGRSTQRVASSGPWDGMSRQRATHRAQTCSAGCGVRTGTSRRVETRAVSRATRSS